MSAHAMAAILGLADPAVPAVRAFPGTMEYVFLGLWALMSTLYWLNYRKDENLGSSALKVGLMLGFMYGLMRFFDWVQHKVPVGEAITFGLSFPKLTEPLVPRIPLLADVLLWFVIALLVAVAWYARHKVGTVASLVLSTWDRGNWYMLPVIFVLLTIGLLLVAAAASPVLSPFIYTLF